MSDPRKSAEDAAFERELAAASRAYREADSARDHVLPPPAMDDAIRAAARRAVHAAPRPAQKPWLLRFSKPLSVAAVLVLTASLVIVMKQEEPEMVPPLPGKVEKIALSPTAPNQILEEAKAPMALGQADRAALARPAPEVTFSAPTPAPGISGRVALAPAPERDELAKRAAPAERTVIAPVPLIVQAPAPVPVPEAQIAAPSTTAAPPAVAPPPAPPAYASVAPTPAPAAVAAAPAAARANIADQARERRADATNAAGAAPVALAKQEAAAVAMPAPAASRAAGTMVAETKQAIPMLRSQASATSIVTHATPAPALKVTGEAADMAKTTELPEAWLKRIIELRKQMKAREADEEFVRFRKAYPDYVIPPELKASVAR